MAHFVKKYQIDFTKIKPFQQSTLLDALSLSLKAIWV